MYSLEKQAVFESCGKRFDYALASRLPGDIIEGLR